jgi:hypothetical protein
MQDRVASLPIGTHIYRVANNNSDDDNTVVENYYQLGKAEFRGHGIKSKRLAECSMAEAQRCSAERTA